MAVFSKLIPVYATCEEYVHPWTSNCVDATAELFLNAAENTLKIYTTAYLLALLTRGKIPKLEDLKKTVLGILQSSAFLTTNAFTYSIFLCTIRKIFGKFNIWTISFVPAIFAALAAILVERPSRRNLLCLYVCNEATETLWRMAESRQMVRSIKHGQVIIFSASMAILLYYYRSSNFLNDDSVSSIIRFVIGPYEENGYIPPENTYITTPVCDTTKPKVAPEHPRKVSIYFYISQALKLYNNFTKKLKSCGKHKSCPHPDSCMFYTIQGGVKLFTLGVTLQIILRTVLQMKRIAKNPKSFPDVIFNKSNLTVGAFVGCFTGLYRFSSCALRWLTGKDSALYALPAGFVAGVAFTQYPDNSVALYIMWKMLQLSYNAGVKKGILPVVPAANVILYVMATSTLFHAAIMEPMNIRPSYWKFLHTLSGGRIAGMARPPLDVWGLKTSEALAKVLKLTNTANEIHTFL